MTSLLQNGGGRMASLAFLDGDFEVIQAGDYVRCSVTGKAIPLGDLRYWSVDRQEAYADAAAATQAYEDAMKNGEGF